MPLFRHPLKKLTVAAALGTGYVLGARAGHTRYRQLRRVAIRANHDPRLRALADRARLFGGGIRVDEPPTPHPLLSDGHVESDEELVYSAGPDVEATIAESGIADPRGQ